MHRLWTFLLLLTGNLYAQDMIWQDDFKSYRSVSELNQFWDARQINNLRFADCRVKLFSNGQAAIRELQSDWTPGKSVETEIAITLDNGKTEGRILFSHNKIDWLNYQGGVLLKSGLRPMYCDAGEWKESKLAPVKEGQRYMVKYCLYPSFSGSSSYDIFINDQKIGEKLLFRDDLKQQPTNQIGVICLGGQAETLSMSLDYAHSRYAMSFKVEDKDKVKASLGEIPVGGRVFRDNRINIKVDFAGELGAVSAVRLAVYPNHRNHADQAEAAAVATVDLDRKPSSHEEFDLANIPYGMHTLRISCVINGKEYVQQEELISMIHQNVVADPRNCWGIISHGDRFDRNINLELDNVAAAGGSWTRMEFILAEICKDGKFDFSHHHQLYEAGKARNIRFFGLLNTTPAGYSLMPGDGYWAQPNLDRWREICTAVMTEFKGQINDWEIWNEPDGFAFWGFSPNVSRAEHHAKMLNIAADVAKSISPDIRVMGPSVTATGEAYFEEVLNSGGVDKIDTVTFHFPAGRSPGEWHRRAQKELQKRYPDRKIQFWISECEFYLQNLIAVLATDRPLPRFLYTIRDKGVERNVFEHENGMCKYNGQPKDKFIAYQFLVKMLGNSRPVGRILFAENLEGYLFERDGKYTAAVWSPGISPIQPIPEQYLQGVNAFDQYGNKLSTSSGGLTAKRGEHENQIIYLSDIRSDSLLGLDAAVNCIGDYTELAAGKSCELKFTFTNLETSAKHYTLKWNADPQMKLSASEQSAEVVAGAVVEKTIVVTPQENAAVTQMFLNGELSDGKQTVKKKFGPFLIDNPKLFAYQEIYRYRKDLNWVLPEECRDIHGEYIFENRSKVDQHKHSLGSSCNPVKSLDGKGLELNYSWKRPVSGWNWMARRYAPLEKIKLNGIPVEFEMQVQLPQTGDLLPLTVLLVFEDATGKEILVEGGGELYWFHKNFKTWKCTIPSRFGTGFIHSVYGGNNEKNIAAYPLYFKGLVLNLVPAQFVWQFKPERPEVTGSIIINQLKIKYFNGQK